MKKIYSRAHIILLTQLLKRYTSMPVIVFLAAILPTKVFAQAPTISYSSPHTYLAGTAITALSPTETGVAAPGYGTPAAIGSGFSLPTGVALDAAGNIYVADAGHNAVKKIPVGGGSPVVLGSGFSNPTAVAVD